MKSKVTEELTLADFESNKAKEFLVDEKEAEDLRKVQEVLNKLNSAQGVMLATVRAEISSLKPATCNKRNIYVKKTPSGLIAYVSAVSKKSFSSYKVPDIAAVYAIEWEESERGWGCRPDGYSFHSSAEKAKAYLAEHYSAHTGPVPDEYSRASGGPQLVEVSPSLYLAVMQKGSVRLWENSLSLYKTFDASNYLE